MRNSESPAASAARPLFCRIVTVLGLSCAYAWGGGSGESSAPPATGPPPVSKSFGASKLLMSAPQFLSGGENDLSQHPLPRWGADTRVWGAPSGPETRWMPLFKRVGGAPWASLDPVGMSACATKTGSSQIPRHQGVRRLISALLCFCRQDYPLLMRCLVSPLFTASKRSR